MGYRCPGQSGRNLKVELHRCSNCGYEVEIFSDELKVTCPNCGRPVYRERVLSCIDWCLAARECVGPGRWERLQEERVEDRLRGVTDRPMAERITADSLLSEVIKRYPETFTIFKQYGMPDYAVERLPMEKISFFAGVHRVDMEKLLEELNRAVAE
jgi:predicted RNA-binding Zn-ribbon protein involved in translation (DUF1610 family)